LYGVGVQLLQKPQIIRNAAARMTTGSWQFDHITPVQLRDLNRVCLCVCVSVGEHISGNTRPKLLFIVRCTAFSVHICLFTRGAILLEIESAPLSEDEVIGPM